MIKPVKIILLLLFLQLAGQKSMAQKDSIRYKIAVFAPLYLDSAYVDDSVYRYAKNVFPRFINPGLEFYEGVQLALDSLNKEKQVLEVFVFDTRSAKETLPEQLNSPQLDSVSFIIAHCSSSEIRLFADEGKKRNIPVINVNMPNDGGVTENPFFVILNPTLRTHCDGIYRYLQKYHALNPIIVFRRKGIMDDRVKLYMEETAGATAAIPLKWKFVEVSDSFTAKDLQPFLDTVQHTMCLTGSLDESFGKKLAVHLAELKKKKYKMSLMGMPTWTTIKDFGKPEYKGLEIIYPDPFYNTKTDKVSASLITYFSTVMYARPSDMVFRGYETAWKFVRLLLEYKSDFSSNINSHHFKIFTDFDIQPVLNRQTFTLDYFENKKLYFLKWQDGVIKAVY